MERLDENFGKSEDLIAKNIEQLKQNLAIIKRGPLPDDLYHQILTLVPDFKEKIIRPGLWQK